MRIFSIMRRVFSIIVIICLIIIGLGVKSAPDDNVSGWAWSESIGWISFNCTDIGCGSSDYGVHVDPDNGKFSGYAWSESIGWISFNETDTGPPPSDDPCPDDSCIAKAIPPGQFGKSNVNVKGWARALSHSNGWDGWIRFDHGKIDEVYIDTEGEFHGWAWGSDAVGWISFNCADRDICQTSSYLVILGPSGLNRPPLASNLSLTEPDWCAEPPSYFFNWTYSDPDQDLESKFVFQIDNDSDFDSPEIDRTYTNLSNPSPSQNSQSVLVAVRDLEGYLKYNETYYWRVRVWDDRGADSGWVSGSSFTTQPHHYPSPDFSWQPKSPIPEENVYFKDETTFYDAEGLAWFWTFQDADPATSTDQNPKTTFISSGSKQVSLLATDSDGYSCSVSKLVRVSLPLPKWQEIKPW